MRVVPDNTHCFKHAHSYPLDQECVYCKVEREAGPLPMKPRERSYYDPREMPKKQKQRIKREALLKQIRKKKLEARS